MVQDGAELEIVIDELLNDPLAAQALGRAGRDILETNRGALSRLLGLLVPLIGDALA